MKIFQNPYVVGGLVLVACAFIFQNNIRPMLKRNASGAGATAPQPAAPAAAPAVQVATPQPTTSAAAAPENPAVREMSKIELARVGWDVNGSPPRDPFQLSGSIMPPARLVPPAGEVLNLTAIWKQTGGSLAVINGRILGAGNTIEGYRIEEIESSLVWVNGPAGREPLAFKATPGAPLDAPLTLTVGTNPTGATNTP